MEPIQLEEGWLTRQMREIRSEVGQWPAEVKILRSINSLLVNTTKEATSGTHSSDGCVSNSQE